MTVGNLFGFSGKIELDLNVTSFEEIVFDKLKGMRGNKAVTEVRENFKEKDFLTLIEENKESEVIEAVKEFTETFSSLLKSGRLEEKQ